jgi:RNA polymerase sigma factor (sigma-70 family)
MKELIDQYQPLWFSIARKYTKDIHASEELIQDALVKFLQAENASVKNVKAYVAKTIYHLYINQIRKDKVRNNYIRQTVESSSEAVDQANRLEIDNDVKIQLGKMYKMLTPGERAVFVLRKAFEMQISNENCRQLMCRAKGKLAGEGKPYFRPGKNEDAFIKAFFRASQQGNMNELIDILKKDMGRKYLSVSRKTIKVSAAKVIGLASQEMKTRKRA